MAEYDGPGAYENAHPDPPDPLADDERDVLRDKEPDVTCRLGADPGDVKMALQAVACLGEPTAEYDYEGWLILGGEVHRVVEVGGCDEDDGYRTYTVVCTVDDD